jgi:hypothetical protein
LGVEATQGLAEFEETEAQQTRVGKSAAGLGNKVDGVYSNVSHTGRRCLSPDR